MAGGIRISPELVPNISKERVKSIIVKLLEKADESGKNAVVYSNLSKLFVTASISESNDKPFSAFDECKAFCDDEELEAAKKHMRIKNPGRNQWNHYPNPIHCSKNVFDEALNELLSEKRLTINKAAKSASYSLSQKSEHGSNWASSVRTNTSDGTLKPKERGWEME